MIYLPNYTGMRFLCLAIAAIAVIGQPTGCLKSVPSTPLTIENLVAASNGRIAYSSIHKRGSLSSTAIIEGNSSDAASEELCRTLLMSLVPFVVIGPADEDRWVNPEFDFVYQSGRNPLFFDVLLRQSDILFRFGRYEYSGGDPVKFASTVESILGRQQERAIAKPVNSR